MKFDARCKCLLPNAPKRTPMATQVAAEMVTADAGLGIRRRGACSLGSVVGENERPSEQIKTTVVNRVRFAVSKVTNGCFLTSQRQTQTVNFRPAPGISRRPALRLLRPVRATEAVPDSGNTAARGLRRKQSRRTCRSALLLRLPTRDELRGLELPRRDSMFGAPLRLSGI